MKKIKLNKSQIYQGNLILVNELYPLKESMDTNQQISIDPNYPDIVMEREAATAYYHIMERLGAAEEIIPVSGYRTKKEQTEIYNHSLKENGKDFTKKYVALPGHSEHQTGLAIDLGIREEEIDFIRPNFPYEGIAQEFRELATSYGYIERYEKGKEAITKISHEPWHFRYIGYPHSKIMQDMGFCLEEYIDYIRRVSYKDSTVHIFFVAIGEEEVSLSLSKNYLYQISGNNVDGCIITKWRNSDE